MKKLLFILLFLFPQLAHAAIQDGLVGWWTFNGKDTVWTSATAATTGDLSGNGKTGTLVSMVQSTSTVPGKIGQALNFDGKAYVSTVGTTLIGTQDLTVCAWLKLPRKPSIRFGSILDNTQFIFNFDSFNYSTIKMTLTNNGGGTTASSGNFNAVGWNYVCGTRVGAVANLFVNGVSSGTLNQAAGTPASTAFTTSIGAESTINSGQADAVIDEVRIYNRILSANEITQLYNIGSVITKNTLTKIKSNVSPIEDLRNGLVRYYTMDGKDTVWTSASAGTIKEAFGSTAGTLDSMIQSTSTLAGKVGQAFNFLGSSRITLGPMTQLENATTASFAFWVKPYSLASGQGIITKLITNNGSADAYSIDITDLFGGTGAANGAITWQWTNGGCIFTSTSVLTIGKWSHVVVVFNGNGLTRATQIQIYVDGVNKALSGCNAAISPATLIATGRNVSIGSSETNASNPNGYLNAAVDDVRFYNRPLNANEALWLYNAGQAVRGK